MTGRLGLVRFAVMAMIFLVACGRPTPLDPGNTSAGFPHPAGYDEGTHGTDALAAGANCSGCHAIAEGDTVQGAAPVAPACQSCHVYPHDTGFAAGDVHGAAWLAPEAPCADCHGADGSRDPADRAAGRCTSCHTTYPHSAGWEEPEAHGSAVLARASDAACLGCHGPVGDAMPERPCAECHAAYPHPDGWFEGAHGVAWRASLVKKAEDPTCGVACHPVASDRGSPDPATGRLACKGCHDLYPHDEGILTAHWVTVQNRGTLTCLNCHRGGDQPGPVLPVTCAPACHAAQGTAR